MKNHITIVGLLFLASVSLGVNAGQKPKAAPTPVENSATQAQAQSLSININTAQVADLVRLKGIGEAKAKAIIEFRKTNGNFKAVKELEQVKGIGAKLVEKNRSLIVL
ncbi:ComEA family DNA-binding protein [Shewanella woodyi]|uniref:ComEA family DNA-binding protein n=1 Tax=Shewanella woodyi TaxID=60961 RepID=UPI0007F8C03B|nr:helix-hairpin-helix domain-containing protein [Shewanella woodyi]